MSARVNSLYEQTKHPTKIFISYIEYLDGEYGGPKEKDLAILNGR